MKCVRISLAVSAAPQPEPEGSRCRDGRPRLGVRSSPVNADARAARFARREQRGCALLRTRLMHDGASVTFRDAILRHAGEAERANTRFSQTCAKGTAGDPRLPQIPLMLPVRGDCLCLIPGLL